MLHLFKHIAIFFILALSLSAATTTCDIDWSDVVGLRVDIQDSGGDTPIGETQSLDKDKKKTPKKACLINIVLNYLVVPITSSSS